MFPLSIAYNREPRKKKMVDIGWNQEPVIRLFFFYRVSVVVQFCYCSNFDFPWFDIHYHILA